MTDTPSLEDSTATVELDKRRIAQLPAPMLGMMMVPTTRTLAAVTVS